MRKSSHLNILLVEILIAILFFSLASTVILKVYAATRSQISLAETTDNARTMILNLSEKCYVTDDIAQLLSENAFEFDEENGNYIYHSDDFTVSAVIEDEKTEAGMIRNVSFTASVADAQVLALNTARYIPEVATQ